MAHIQAYTLGGVHTYTNPFGNRADTPIHSVNVTSNTYGGLTRREGYSAFLGTPDTNQVNSLFSWTRSNAGVAELYLYRASGSVLYNSFQGTGAWTVCGNGTITDGHSVGYSVLDDTLIIGDGKGSTRHTTNGTSFTDTVLAPISNSFIEYQNRIYCTGTANSMFASSDDSASNWATSGTSDSFSIDVPGKGTTSMMFKTGDRVYATTSGGNIYRYDGYALADLATELAPSSPNSYAKVEDYSFWLNRNGVYGFDGANAQLLSNPIQKQIYNDDGTGMAGANFSTSPGVVHHYNYLCAIGTVTDSFTKETINDAIIKYDYQKNMWHNYRFYHNPTAFHSYTDKDGSRQLIFGDKDGQCYKMGNLGDNDGGKPIELVVDFLLYGDDPARDKHWKEIDLFFNPGCSAQIMYAPANTFDQSIKNWVPIGSAQSGHVRYRFGADFRSHVIYLRIMDNSPTSRFRFYGYDIDYELAR